MDQQLSSILSDVSRLNRLCSFVTSNDVLNISRLSKVYRMIIANDLSIKPGVASASIFYDCNTDCHHIKVPLTYCGLEERKSNFYWTPCKSILKDRKTGLSISHLHLTAAFHSLPINQQVSLLWSCNFVQSLTVDTSFFLCRCGVCESLRPAPSLCLNKDASAVCLARPPSGGANEAEAPAVYASFAIVRDDSSPTLSPSSPDNATLPSPSSQSPQVATVEECCWIQPLIGESAAPDRGEIVKTAMNHCSRYPLAIRKEIAIMHTFDQLTLVFQIAYRNRATLQYLEIQGPPSPLSTALMRDDELPKLPFPLKPKQVQTPASVKSEVMPSFGSEPSDELLVDSQPATVDVPITSQKKAVPHSQVSHPWKQPPMFAKLRKAVFGSTVDCRYVVPFLDYSDFQCLTSVTVGRLTAQYNFAKSQFGEKATVVFAPQYIFNKMSFPAAPHLPAIYNGSIDENLRFQGRGIFVCDEYTYEGDFKDGVNNGFGHMKSSAGEMYTGEWKYGQRNGKGKVVQLTGDSLSGTWVNDSLGGFGTLETSEGFSYIGNWMNSRFEGWGSIWYRDCLICYGRFSRGFLSGWSRMIRFIPGSDPMLNWEEGEHDDFGRVNRCFQITLSFPTRWNNGRNALERETVSHMVLRDFASQKRHIESLDLHYLISPPRERSIRHSTNCVLHSEAPILRMHHFQHDFPDEESMFGDDSPTLTSRPLIELCMTPVSPAARQAVQRSFFSPFETPHARQLSIGSSLLVHDSPLPPSLPQETDYMDLHTPDDEEVMVVEAHSPVASLISSFTSSPVNRRASQVNWPRVEETPGTLRIEVASPASRAETGLRRNVLSTRGSRATPEQAARQADRAPPAAGRSPQIERQSVFGDQATSNSQSAAERRSGYNNQSLRAQLRQAQGSEGGGNPTPMENGTSRSRAALLQAMETIENVQKVVDADDEVWNFFRFWDTSFFSRVHCEWMRTDMAIHERHVTSPLTIPMPEEVPNWLRNKIWDYYKYHKQ